MWGDLCGPVYVAMSARLYVNRVPRERPLEWAEINAALYEALNDVHGQRTRSGYWSMTERMTRKQMYTFMRTHDAATRASNPLWEEGLAERMGFSGLWAEWERMRRRA